MSVSDRITASGTGASGPTILATSHSGSSTLAVPHELPPAAKVQRWIVAIAVMSSAVLEVLDTSVVNVSLPHIAGSLSSTVDEATWVLTSYIVANAIILPITGWLANYMGRKRLLMTVVTGFTVSSILCGLAPSLPMLIFFRVLQGTTGGGLQPLSQAVLLEEFPGRERGKAMAFWGMGIVAAPILGPTIGGWITDSYSWRWVFYINIPVGILSLFLIYFFVHDPHYIRRGSLRADFWGLGMLALGMGALQIMLDRGQEQDWFGSEFIRVLAVMAVVFLTAFVIRELTVKDPIVHFHLMRFRAFATGIGLAAVLGFVLYGGLILLPLFMQTLLGWTAATAGLWTSPRGIGTAMCMPLVGYLLGRGWDGRRMLAFGFGIAGLSFFGFAHMTLQSGTWDIFWIQITQGAAMGLLFVPLTTLTMASIPPQETGYATSLYSVTRNIGSSMGISFVTTWITRRSQFHQTILASHITASSRMSQEAMQQITGFLQQSGIDRVTARHEAGALIYRTMQQQAALLSYVDVFYIMGLLFLAVIPLVFLMKRPSHSIAR
ncbi:MAG: DHA2 family efflux MFS transporter permease subunit [Acidobacteriaceae bacterium]